MNLAIYIIWRYLEVKILANSLQMKYGYGNICKVEGENFGD